MTIAYTLDLDDLGSGGGAPSTLPASMWCPSSPVSPSATRRSPPP